jgi:hypothetical protein
MADTLNYQPLQRLTCKDIENLLIVSKATAQRYYSDIKQAYSIDLVTYKHFTMYFKL